MRARWHALHKKLIAVTTRRCFETTYGTMIERHQCLAQHPEPLSLIDRMHSRDGDPQIKNTVLSCLVAEVGRYPEVASTVVLLALWPGLDAIYSRQRRYFAEAPDLLAAEIIGRATEEIASLDLGRVNRIAATILKNVERDIRRMLAARWNSPEFAVDGDAVDWFGIAHPEQDNTRSILWPLKEMFGRDGELIHAVDNLGFSQKEAARAFGITHETARKRYQRAWRRIRAHSEIDD